jgi:hypothetical protein
VIEVIGIAPTNVRTWRDANRFVRPDDGTRKVLRAARIMPIGNVHIVNANDKA